MVTLVICFVLKYVVFFLSTEKYFFSLYEHALDQSIRNSYIAMKYEKTQLLFIRNEYLQNAAKLTVEKFRQSQLSKRNRNINPLIEFHW